MKKLIAKVVVILMLAFGLTGVASVANAAPAHAGTASSCRQIYAGAGYYFWTNTGGYKYAAYCYVDYDWVEETFFGMHDGWRFVAYDNTYCSGYIRQWVNPCY